MEELEHAFPGLCGTKYRVTSPVDPHYNCLAWAASQTTVWWEPDPMGLYWWPLEAPREASLDAFAVAYGLRGYEGCQSTELEPQFERVAIFVDANGIPTHAARQLGNGKWTSKLGEHVDIEHDLKALEGNTYGTVALVMKRRRPDRPGADQIPPE
ncbi:MAG: hypothetical protein GY778_30595 [bacterium]|nr:hypothetical protein [bacterium]